MQLMCATPSGGLRARARHVAVFPLAGKPQSATTHTGAGAASSKTAVGDCEVLGIRGCALGELVLVAVDESGAPICSHPACND